MYFIDINECQSDNDHTCKGQGQICINTAGSYQCACAKAYRKKNDGSCESVDVTTPKPTFSWFNF